MHANRMRRCAVPGGTGEGESTHERRRRRPVRAGTEADQVLPARPLARARRRDPRGHGGRHLHLAPGQADRRRRASTRRSPTRCRRRRSSPRPRARPSTGSTPPSRRSPTRCRRSSPARTPAPRRAPPTASPATSPSNPEDLGAVRVGPIVVNLEQLHSDNNLRDARLRLDYLESHEHPLATFKVDEVSGLSGEAGRGRAAGLRAVPASSRSRRSRSRSRSPAPPPSPTAR